MSEEEDGSFEVDGGQRVKESDHALGAGGRVREA